MESSEHSVQSIRDIENSIQNSVDDVLISNNNSKCGICNNCNRYQIFFYTGLIIFIIIIIIILIIRLK